VREGGRKQRDRKRGDFGGLPLFSFVRRSPNPPKLRMSRWSSVRWTRTLIKPHPGGVLMVNDNL